MARFRVVLVRPEHGANVGASARLVRNTGAEGLDLVDPGDWRTVECWRTAWGAQEVLESARVLPDLSSALEGASLAVALSGRRGSGPPSIDVRDAARAVASLSRDEAAALVFGPETSGLTNEELACCGACARIPVDPGQPSLNLSHAVAIAAYEVHRAVAPPPSGDPRLATHDEKERLLALLREGLLAVGGLPTLRADGAFREWRALIQRTGLTPRELRLLEHMARKMSRAGGRSEGG
jgi:TrmH family RNA methyltransferase